nr:xanthine dehydrogenase accessory protein XdhC [Amylibacter marinus]
MGFDRAQLERHVGQGPVARIVIAAHQGSVPRGTGTSMLLTSDGPFGTIGGGALELQALALAEKIRGGDQAQCITVPLGPALGQCCGGRVTLVIERYTRETLPQAGLFFARGIRASTQSLAVARKIAGLRNGQGINETLLIDGWLFEPVVAPLQPLWIYGAGHVGRAIVDVMQGLDFDITWVDTAPDRFPAHCPVQTLVSANPAHVVRYAPKNAFHLILTYSHAFDFDLCHQLLQHPHAWAGLIGSKTKWRRFQKRLADLGHRPEEIGAICCPIGAPNLGKSPKSIAIGVAGQLLSIRAGNWAGERKKI